jgi:hypothetical protein
MKKHFLPILALLVAALLVSCLQRPAFRVEVYPQYEKLFDNQNGWTGADGAYSVALEDDVILWLFGDTWIGRIRGDRHVDAVIVNNSIALQRGKNPTTASVNFYYGRTPDGKPVAFIRPAEGKGWFWIYHGAPTSKGLYLFLIRIEPTDEKSDSGFKVSGTWLGHVANPEDPPKEWHLTQQKIPWGKFSTFGNTFFGSFLLKAEGFIYIYGITEEIVDGFPKKYMILARVPEAALDDFDQWRFFADGRWTANLSAATRLCGNMANEYSVSFQPVLGKYIVVYSEDGVSKNIVARLAPTPHGPWSEPMLLYQCPEENRRKNIFCYAAKGHPEISTASDELIVTYVANSSDFRLIVEDAELYRPRFLRVRFMFSKPR